MIEMSSLVFYSEIKTGLGREKIQGFGNKKIKQKVGDWKLGSKRGKVEKKVRYTEV